MGPAGRKAPRQTAAKRGDEANRLRKDCLDAGIANRDIEKKELLSLIHRDPQFRRFEDEIEFARHFYTNCEVRPQSPFGEPSLLEKRQRIQSVMIRRDR